MSEELFDFGFTFANEDELEVVQQAHQTNELNTSAVISTQEKLDKLFNAITPLLNNLKKNPEKEYILWPNRLDKIEQFEDHIQNIYKG